MSTIISPDNTVSLLETTTPGGGFAVVGQRDQENIIEIKGDAPVAIIGGSKSDTITTGAGDGKIFTGGGDDVINGGSGDDILRGGTGNDSIKGFVGDDVLQGGEGNDTLNGGFGNDILKGGSGDDIFEFAASEYKQGSIDKIQDFKAGNFTDKIKIFGVADNSELTYDRKSGFVLMDGQQIIDVGKNLNVQIDAPGEEDQKGTWELF
ncbi:MAG: calcium-binding protein [Waterburya sp.]